MNQHGTLTREEVARKTTRLEEHLRRCPDFQQRFVANPSMDRITDAIIRLSRDCVLCKAAVGLINHSRNSRTETTIKLLEVLVQSNSELRQKFSRLLTKTNINGG